MHRRKGKVAGSSFDNDVYSSNNNNTLGWETEDITIGKLNGET